MKHGMASQGSKVGKETADLEGLADLEALVAREGAMAPEIRCKRRRERAESTTIIRDSQAMKKSEENTKKAEKDLAGDSFDGRLETVLREHSGRDRPSEGAAAEEFHPISE